jgi:hypothetical protein
MKAKHHHYLHVKDNKHTSLNIELYLLIHRPSTINHQPSTINHQPSTINHQPSTINHQPSTINHQPSTINHALAIPSFIVLFTSSNMRLVAE